ncbi:rod shape-determining protein RodA [Candidatus Parcubacteria bacterium]|nr:rod shape-determining protein RodA [Candidatus Parcubacteria bacterium]
MTKSFIHHLKRLDWVLIGCVILLVFIGFLSLYSSSLGKDSFLNFNKQIIFFSIGILLMFLVSFFDYRAIKNSPYSILIFYFLCCLALLGLFFFAPEIRGSRGWYKIGGISIDPIEFTKLALIILLAKYFSMRHIEMYGLRHILISSVYFLIPSALIFFQPDLGSILILLCLWVGVLVISGIKLKHFLILIFCGILIFTLSWSFLLKDYQKSRILSFIQPQLEPLGVGWSQNQSKIAIGSGGLFGQGIGHGSQTQYGFLSEPQTDFIFASIAEEMGLMGVVTILILFLIVLFRIFKIAIISSSNFQRLFASGVGIILMAQIFINIGMNLGLLPIIGISLPFISYGGNNLVLTFLALGILQNIYSQRKEMEL